MTRFQSDNVCRPGRIVGQCWELWIVSIPSGNCCFIGTGLDVASFRDIWDLILKAWNLVEHPRLASGAVWDPNVLSYAGNPHLDCNLPSYRGASSRFYSKSRASLARARSILFGVHGSDQMVDQGLVNKSCSQTPCYVRSFLLLVVRPGATSSVHAPSSDALCY